MNQLSGHLSGELAKLAANKLLQVRQGVVIAVAAATPSTLTIRLAGADTLHDVAGVSFLESYRNPRVNDVVWMLQNGPDLLVLGSITPAVPPSVVASYNTATNLGNAAWSGFNLTTVTDTDTMHDDATNPSRITIKTAGRYLITATVGFGTNATGARGIQVRANAAGLVSGGTLLGQSIIMANAAGGSYPFVALEYVLAVNDYVEMFGYQSSGAALAMSVGYPLSYISARLTAPA